MPTLPTREQRIRDLRHKQDRLAIAVELFKQDISQPECPADEKSKLHNAIALKEKQMAAMNTELVRLTSGSKS